MQITEMKSLRSLCLHKRFISRNPSKITNHLSFRFVSRHSPQFLRHFCSAGESGSGQTGHGAGEAPRGWSMYRNVDGGLFSDKIEDKSSLQVLPPGSDGEDNFGFSVIDENVEGFEVQGRYDEGKDGNLSNGGKNPSGMSDCDSEVNVFSKEKPDWSVKKVNLGNGLGLSDIVGSKKKGKSKAKYVCEECGHSEGQWWGMCPSCGASAKMKRFYEEEANTKRSMVSEKVVKSWLPQYQEDLKPVRLRDVVSGVNNHHWRIPLSGTFGNEVARVLGGGLVPGSLVLIGGDPGVGKSTLLLQMAAIIADGQTQGPVVYVSGEESIEQISSRADRMEIGAEDLFLYSSTDIEDILTQIQPLSPRALVIDSIQTVYLNDVSGSAGGINQVKECTSALLRFAKKTNIPVLLVGHVTKSGDIAGPRVLEHIVDVVLYLEGEKYSSHRLLRAVKNRFGSIDELGIFEMAQLGLQAVTNPSEMFLSGDQRSDSEFLAGLAVAVVMDASRTFLIEIQALCLSGSTPSRHVNGIQGSRADMIISVLIKQAGLKIQENAVFLNVVSGVVLTETAGDLAIAAAICSSFLECPIPVGIAFIGEIGLAGELRMVPRMDKRVNTVAQLGYKKCIIPKSAEKSLAILELEDMELIACANLKEVINTVFR